MNKWPMTEKAVFDKTVWELCKMLDADPDLREKCKKDRAAAKATLKKAGNFDQIPNDVEVFVMEDDVAANSKVVTIKLPPRTELPDQAHFEAKKFWPCTWNIY